MALLAAISIVVYLPAVRGAFIWDELLSIQENPFLHRADGIFSIWTTIGKIPAEEHYWPMTYSVLWLETQLWDGWMPGFHLVNFLLHAAIVIQIWRLMRRIGLPGALFGAALFALHPVHAEAVAWIMSVKDLLATLFALIAIEFYLNHEDRGGWKWLALACVALVAALFSKSSPVMVPFALAILAWYRRGRITQRDVIGFGVLAAVAFLVVFADTQVVRLVNVGEHHTVPPLSRRIPQTGIAFLFYLHKLIWPVNLGPIYPQFPHVGQMIGWVPLIAIAIMTGLLWFARRRIGRGPLACWLFYGAMLAPALGIVWFSFLTSSPAADRYQYFASIGPLVGLGALAGAYRAKYGLRPAHWAVVIALMFTLASFTWRQARYYRSPAAFYAHAMDIAPESDLIYFNLASAAYSQKLYKEAETFFAEAHRLKPDNGQTVYVLGVVLSERDKYAEAIELYEKSIAAGCEHPDVWANLAWLLSVAPDARLRNPQRALQLATECVQRAPKMEAMNLSALAAAQAANGMMRQAAETARQAIQLATGDYKSRDVLKEMKAALPCYERGEQYILKPNKK